MDAVITHWVVDLAMPVELWRALMPNKMAVRLMAMANTNIFKRPE